MSNEVDYYDVQGMIRDARSEIRAEIANAVRDVCRELRNEMDDLSREMRERIAVAVIEGRTE